MPYATDSQRGRGAGALSVTGRSVVGMEGKEPRGRPWTAETVLGLAPDAASRAAAGRLSAPGPWADEGAGDDAVWGLCEGSGSGPYRVVVDVRGPAYSCSCPSRKLPCKHALGLLLRWAGGGTAAGPVPGWAGEWLADRRERAARRASGKGQDGASSGDADGAAEAADAGQRAQQRTQQRTQQRAQRLRRMAAGATELEQRLADLLRDGLASAPLAGAWEETAARMVDAQAPGLAARARELGALPASGAGWPARMLAECALLHLLDQAFLRLDELPEPLAATVRSRVGLTVDSARLLREGTVRDSWLVLAQEDADDARLTTRRIWLYGEATARMALLLSYGAAGRAPEVSLPTGLVLDAELAFHPGAYPLRVALGQVHAGPRAAEGAEGGDGASMPAGLGVERAVAAYGDALRADPWLDAVPVLLTEVVPVPETGDAGWQLAAADGGAAVPLHPGSAGGPGAWQLLAVSGGGPVAVFGELGHAGFRPLTTWSAGTAVSLTEPVTRSGV